MYTVQNIFIIPRSTSSSQLFCTEIRHPAVDMFFLEVLPFLLLIAVLVAIAQFVMQQDDLQFDFDLSLAGPAYH
jgi:hypothetical protein